MDHFNITLQKDGELVATRRGLQVSKQKHHGISFVNSSCPQATDGGRSAPVDFSKPLQQRWRFVTKDKEPRRATAKTNLKPTKASEARKGHRAGQAKNGKRAKRLSDKALLTDTAPPLPPKNSNRKHHSPFAFVASQELIDFLDGRDLSTPPPYVDEIPPPLPIWATHNIPLNLKDQRLFHSFFSLVPRKMYPFEDILSYNPARSQEFYWTVVENDAATHCVLMCGSMFRSVLKRERNSQELAYHISMVCSIINRQLDAKPERIPNSILECITSLALMSNFIGRYDHWHVHMTGLQKVVELNGGFEDLHPALLAKIRKTDLKGAATLGTTPYLPFTRSRANISDVLPLEIRNAVTKEMKSLLEPCGVPPSVTESLTSFSIFIRAIHLASSCSPPRSVAFDPHGFTEELHWIHYQLLCHPGPLRDSSSSNNPPIDVSKLKTENLVGNHQVPLTTPLVPAKHDNFLEPSLRICSLLYLKELIPDFPRNLGGYSILLNLLRSHMESTCAAAELVDNPSSGPLRDDLAFIAAVRPAFLWICVLGDAVSRTADVNECRFGADCYDRGHYRKALGITLEAVEGGVDGLNERDMTMFRLLDLRRIQGEAWDDRAAMRRMLAERT